MQTNSPHGLLLVGHGTRDPAGVAAVVDLAGQLAAARPDAVVQHAFLELADPNLADGIVRCVERGVQRLAIQPLLLFAAGHAKRDLPAAAAEARRRFPELEIRIGAALNCSTSLLELSELRYTEALASQQVVSDEETLLLMVGRGSHDPLANQEFVRFSLLRQARQRLRCVRICYAAMATPSLADGLEAIAALSGRRIVVQPHLLFAGELLARVQREVALAAVRHPEKDWSITGPLGAHALLRNALIQLAESVWTSPERLPETSTNATFNEVDGG